MHTYFKRPFLFLLLLQAYYGLMFDQIHSLQNRLLLSLGLVIIQFVWAYTQKSQSLYWFIICSHFILLGINMNHHYVEHTAYSLKKESQIYDTIKFILEKTIKKNDANYWIGYTWKEHRKDRIKLQTHNSESLFYGDTIDMVIEYKSIARSASWESFNKIDYFRRRHIHHEAKAILEINKYHSNQKLSLWRWTQKTQFALEEKLETQIQDSFSLALSLGLLLGITRDMEKEVITSFQQTGTAHVLAVSGLHVGMIYFIVAQILSPLRKQNRSLRKLASIISIAFIWYFSFITGLQAAILRACIMFTVHEVGRQLYKRNDSQNNLFGCATIMLIYDPCTLFDIGFQLSFMAMLSIILFQPMLHGFLRSKNKVINYIMELIKTSLAVQILISPLGIFYFHQFPLSFIIANLVWIPLSFIIMCLAILIIFTQGEITQIINLLLQKSCEFGIQCFNLIKKLPFYYVDELSVDFFQLAILYLIFASAYWYYKFDKPLFFGIFTGLSIVFFALSPIRQYQQGKINEIVIYDLSYQIAVDIRQGQECSRYSNKSNSRRTMDEYIQNNQIKNLQLHMIPSPKVSMPSIIINCHEIIFDPSTPFEKTNKNILILSYNTAFADPNCYAAIKNIDMIFIPSSLDKIAGQWKQYAMKYDIKTHEAKHDGHLKITI